MRLSHLVLLAGALTLAPIASATAQAPSARSALAAGPRLDASVAGIVRAPSAPAEFDVLAQNPRRSRAKPTSLMIIGGAALIGGLLIGDAAGTAIAVGGLAVGIYGLYLYLP